MQVKGWIVVLGGLSLCRQLGKDLQIYSLCTSLLSDHIQRSSGALRGRGAVVRCGGLAEVTQQRPLCASSWYIAWRLIATARSEPTPTFSVAADYLFSFTGSSTDRHCQKQSGLVQMSSNEFKWNVFIAPADCVQKQPQSAAVTSQHNLSAATERWLCYAVESAGQMMRLRGSKDRSWVWLICVHSSYIITYLFIYWIFEGCCVFECIFP